MIARIENFLFFTDSFPKNSSNHMGKTKLRGDFSVFALTKYMGYASGIMVVRGFSFLKFSSNSIEISFCSRDKFNRIKMKANKIADGDREQKLCVDGKTDFSNFNYSSPKRDDWCIVSRSHGNIDTSRYSRLLFTPVLQDGLTQGARVHLIGTRF